MNPRLQKITDEIEKIKNKLNNYQSRLRELERKKVSLENAEIVALVRGIDIQPDEFAGFVRIIKDSQGCAVPDIQTLFNDETGKKEVAAVGD